MKIIRKDVLKNGQKCIRFCGIKIYTYLPKSILKNYLSAIEMDVLKYKGVLICKQGIENIVLGSSHARHGFVPDINDYNLGGSSQDLYTSFNLYEWILKNGFQNLRNIILFYSPFSPGFQLSKTSEAWKCITYKTFYNMIISQACLGMQNILKIN